MIDNDRMTIFVLPHRAAFGLAAGLLSGLLAFTWATSIGHAAETRSGVRGWHVQLVRVSRSDPYARGCGVPGAIDRQANTEPSIAADPVNPQKEVIAFHAAYRTGGGFVDDLVMRSADGGNHWRRMTPPGTTVCTGGRADRNSDPWVAFGPDGRAYFVSLPGRLDRDGFPLTSVLVHRSDPAVNRWQKPRVAAGGGFNDREELTVDPRHPGRVFVTWIRRSGPQRLHSVLVAASSGDGGKSWRQTIAYRPPASVAFVVPVQAHIVVLPNGTLLDTFMLYQASGQWPIEVIRSINGGRTWSSPRILGYATLAAPGDRTDGIQTNMAPIAQSAADSDGTTYVVWNDNAPDRSRVLIASSRDTGRSWSVPRIVASPRAQVLLPAVAVLQNHALAVTYYDFRHDRPGNGKLITDVWFDVSQDRGRHWSEGHVAGPFDMKGAEHITDKDAPGLGPGYYLGDYTTLAPQGNGFAAALALSAPYARPNQPAIYVARIFRK